MPFKLLGAMSFIGAAWCVVIAVPRIAIEGEGPSWHIVKRYFLPPEYSIFVLLFVVFVAAGIWCFFKK